MKSKIILRAASGLILVHFIGHGVGHLTWDKPEDARMNNVIATMKGYKAEFMGATRSMADYYNGYSLMIFGLFAMSILVLWVVSTIIDEQKQMANKLLLPIGLTYVFFGVIEFLYFFPFAASMSLLAGLLVCYCVAKKG